MTPSRATAAKVLECRAIERRFGGLVALTGVDLHIERGEIFGLVGPNGSGKTTLTNAITGFYPPQKGAIVLNGQDITGLAPHRVARLGVARTFQNLALFNGMTVLDNILLGRHVRMRPSVVRTLFYRWLSLEGLRHLLDTSNRGTPGRVDAVARDRLQAGEQHDREERITLPRGDEDDRGERRVVAARKKDRLVDHPGEDQHEVDDAGLAVEQEHPDEARDHRGDRPRADQRDPR